MSGPLANLARMSDEQIEHEANRMVWLMLKEMMYNTLEIVRRYATFKFQEIIGLGIPLAHDTSMIVHQDGVELRIYAKVPDWGHRELAEQLKGRMKLIAKRLRNMRRMMHNARGFIDYERQEFGKEVDVGEEEEEEEEE